MFKPNLKDYGYGFAIEKATLGPNKLSVPLIRHGGGINGFNTTIVRMVGEKRLVVLLDNTERGQYLERIVSGIASILYDQPYDTPKQSITEIILKTVLDHDVATAIKQYRALKAGTTAGEHDFARTELNTVGYQLLQMKKVAYAIEIFKLNVEVYPQVFNTYERLGEAYAINGNKELAIANYKKSLELNPKNTSARAGLAKLTNEGKDIKVDPKVYDTYAGDYRLLPRSVITITNESGKLMIQTTGQPKRELVPFSEADFSLREVNEEISFVMNEQGQVTELILNQNGLRIAAKKLSKHDWGALNDGEIETQTAMTLKTSCAAVLFISLLGLAASAQEPTDPRPKRARVAEDYQVGTLKELAAKATSAESIGNKQETMLIDPDLSPTRVRATYGELTARIPDAKAELIRQWARRYAGAPETYTKNYEIDVAFTENGSAYWLTFSKKTLDSFWKADVLNKPVDLFLIKDGSYQARRQMGASASR